MKIISAAGCTLLLGLALISGGCQRDSSHSHGHSDHHGHHEEHEEFARGPHGGRLLEDRNFSVELLIFETGVPPQYRIYAFDGNDFVKPEHYSVSLELHRLGGRVEAFTFTPHGNFFSSDKIVEEPHSFDVKVTAEYKGEKHHW